MEQYKGYFLVAIVTSLFGVIYGSAIGFSQVTTSPCTYPGFEKCECVSRSKAGSVEQLNCINTHLQDISILRNLPHANLSRSLQTMRFRGNNFTEVPKNFVSDCSKAGQNTYRNSYLNLETLDLTDNNIQVIHGKSFHCIPNLKELFLDDNNLDEWVFDKNSRMFSDLDLEILHMRNVFKFKSHGKIKQPVSFSKVFGDSDLEFLTELHLENNFFGNINTGVFKKLPELRKLFLSHNLIQNPMLSSDCVNEGGMLVKCKLSHIYLNNNSISYLEQEFLDELDKMWPQIKTIDLSNNPFWCDCNMKPFFKWINSFNATGDIHRIQNLHHYKCSGPEPLKDKYIVDLKLSNLEECQLQTVANLDTETHGAQVVLGLFLALIAVAVIGIAIWKRQIIKTKTKNIARPWMPRLFSRASGYSTVQSPPSTTV